MESTNLKYIRIQYFEKVLENYRLKSALGYELTDFEKDEFAALKLYMDHTAFTPQDKEWVTDPATGHIRPEVERKYLIVKSVSEDLTEMDRKVLEYHENGRLSGREELIMKEIALQGNEVSSVPEGMSRQIRTLITGFESEVLWNCPKPIWWDAASCLHVAAPLMLLDAEDYYEEYDFIGNCAFNRNYLKDTLRMLSSEIEEHFGKHPAESFVRGEDAPVTCDECDFVLEIEPSGRIADFRMI